MNYLNLIKSNAIRNYVKENDFSESELCAIIALYRQVKLNDRLDAYEEIFSNNDSAVKEEVTAFISESRKMLKEFLCSDEHSEYQVNCYEEDQRSWEEIMSNSDDTSEASQKDMLYPDFREAISAALEKSKSVPEDDTFYHYPIIIRKDSGENLAVTINLQGEITDIGFFKDEFISNDFFYHKGFDIRVPFEKGDIVSVNDELMIYYDKESASDIAEVLSVYIDGDYVEINNGINFPVAEMEYPDQDILEEFGDALEDVSEDVKDGFYDEDYEDEEDFFDEFEEEE